MWRTQNDLVRIRIPLFYCWSGSEFYLLWLYGEIIKNFSYILSFFFTFLIKKIKVIGTISQICSFLLLIFNFQKFIFSFNIFKWAIYSDLDVDPWLKISVSSNPDPQLWHYFASEFRRVAPGTGRAWRGQWGWSPQWPGWRCTCGSQCACVWIVKNYSFGLTKLILTH